MLITFWHDTGQQSTHGSSVLDPIDPNDAAADGRMDPLRRCLADVRTVQPSSSILSELTCLDLPESHSQRHLDVKLYWTGCISLTLVNSCLFGMLSLHKLKITGQNHV